MKLSGVYKFVVLLLLFTVLAACSSSKKKELKPVELEAFEERVKVKKIWSRGIGDVGKYYHQFLVALDRNYLYAASAKGKVYKLDKETGKKNLEGQS